jgi:hypothetical protein
MVEDSWRVILNIIIVYPCTEIRISLGFKSLDILYLLGGHVEVKIFTYNIIFNYLFF